MYSITDLLVNRFLSRNPEEQLQIKEAGRPCPNLDTPYTQLIDNRVIVRNFDPEVYARYNWLCGCDVKDALYCFPCVLFGGEPLWAQTGFTDISNLSNAVAKHEIDQNHIHNCINLSIIGRKSQSKKSLSELKKTIEQHNIQVEKNLQVLDLLIGSIKLCAHGYIPIMKRQYDEDDEDYYLMDEDPFHELLELVSGPNNTLKNHLKMDIFKRDMESMKADIIQSAFEVYQEEILREIKSVEFVSLIVEELGDCHYFRKVLILRYVVDNKPVERIWKLLKYESCLFEALKTELNTILDVPTKLISQSYRELNLKRKGPTHNLHYKILKLYPNANLVNFYRHKLHDIIVSTIDFDVQIRSFFSYIWSICNFFTVEPTATKVTELFENIVNKRTNNRKKWDFVDDQINTVYNYKEELIETMNAIEENDMKYCDADLLRAHHLASELKDDDFEYWLDSFHKIVPHIEYYMTEYDNCLKPIDPDFSTFLYQDNIDRILGGESMIPVLFDTSMVTTGDLTNPNLMPIKMEDDLEIFETVVETVKMETETAMKIEGPICSGTSTDVSRKRKHDDSKKELEIQVIHCMMLQLQERLKFRGHMFAARLVDPRQFQQYRSEFPESFFEITLGSFQTLNSIKLRVELQVLYERMEFQSLTGSSSLLQAISENDLLSTFAETVRLLNIVLTIPAKTDEDSRCFCTLDEVNFFLKHCKDEGHLQYIVALACEKEFVDNVYEFNDKVVRIFAEKPRMIKHFKRQTLEEKY